MKRLPLAAAALVAVAAFGLTGCGGDDKSPGASQSMPKDQQDQMVKYAKCLEEHGLTGKLPPRKAGGPVQVAGPVDPKVQAAQSACAKLAPRLEGEEVPQKEQDYALKMAECLRKQGLSAKDPSPGSSDVVVDQATSVPQQKLVDAYAACNKQVPAPKS
ncbi:hypothetical protein GCM10022254_47200 [Actinomadura meridiana]|uniref:Secreted protein n=1 Tax=Actinomadura meridiana TaxID=559626 RepID=A0ABP8CAV8_9ACTN